LLKKLLAVDHGSHFMIIRVSPPADRCRPRCLGIQQTPADSLRVELIRPTTPPRKTLAVGYASA